MRGVLRKGCHRYSCGLLSSPWPRTATHCWQLQSRLQQYPCRWASNWSLIKAIRLIVQGDDRINPKKLLERRYLYSALLGVKFRELRLKHGINPNDKESSDRLYDQAIVELDEGGIDQLSNVDLRQKMQLSVEPQVREILKAFDRVDNRLGIKPSGLFSVPKSESSPISNFDWEPYKDILLDEYHRVCAAVDTAGSQQQQDGSDHPSVTFHDRKQGAIDTLLDFHGWSTGALSSNKKSNICASEQVGDNTDDFGMEVSSGNDTRLELIRAYQTVNICRSALIRHELGYSILSFKSLMPGAGRGTFLDGEALAGSLVAFQPGEVWPKEHLLTTAADVIEHFEGDDDCHISLRFDDFVLDSRQSPVTVLTQDGSMNPWALGHMVNHPPKARMPNCQSTPLNFTERMKLDALDRYVPNIYARPPGWQTRFFFSDNILMHGLCLLARRDISNDELVYDYRLQSDETPDWYSVVHYGEDIDDEQVVFFRDDWMK